MRTRAKQKFVTKATALGARVPRAELFVLWNFFKKLAIKLREEKILESKKRSAPNEWKYGAFKFCVSEFPDGD